MSVSTWAKPGQWEWWRAGQETSVWSWACHLQAMQPWTDYLKVLEVCSWLLSYLLWGYNEICVQEFCKFGDTHTKHYHQVETQACRQ